MVPEQRGYADAEEDGDQEDEDHMVLGHPNTAIGFIKERTKVEKKKSFNIFFL